MIRNALGYVLLACLIAFGSIPMVLLIRDHQEDQRDAAACRDLGGILVATKPSGTACIHYQHPKGKQQ